VFAKILVFLDSKAAKNS